MSDLGKREWLVVHVEDDLTVRRQVKEYLDGEHFEFGEFNVSETAKFEDALALLRERKVDLVILDVYRGSPADGNRAGLPVLETWRATGFAPIILHTALPEGLEEHASPFVHIVPKEAGNLARLKATIGQIFATKIPQIHRATVQHLDSSFREYMWGFVQEHWDEIKDLAQQPDFIRLLLRRLGLQFTHGVAPLIQAVYSDATPADPVETRIHPVEYYVRPPIGYDPQLGDLRRLCRDRDQALVVVVWPSCDLVHRDGRCKVDRALCAHTRPLADFNEYTKWFSEDTPSNTIEEALTALITNNRRQGQRERYHFLPPAWDMPALVIDFGDLEHVPVSELKAAQCVATVASPFAESISGRLVHYLGRLGTPDLDLNIVLASLRSPTPT